MNRESFKKGDKVVLINGGIISAEERFERLDLNATYHEDSIESMINELDPENNPQEVRNYDPDDHTVMFWDWSDWFYAERFTANLFVHEFKKRLANEERDTSRG